MHILLGFVVAAALLYFWARGSIIVAIMGTLATMPIFAVCVVDAALPGLLISIIALVIVWAPHYVQHKAARPVTIVASTVRVVR